MKVVLQRVYKACREYFGNSNTLTGTKNLIEYMQLTTSAGKLTGYNKKPVFNKINDGAIYIK